MSPEPDKRPSRRRSLLKKLALLLTSFVVAIVLAEIGLRIYVAVTDAEIAEFETAFVESSEKLHAFDPEIGWVLKPNYDRDDIVTNSLGFRMSTEPAPASGRRKRNVVLLGDSMLFGIRVEQESIFSERLNEAMPGYTFVNTGAVGYNTAQELIMLRRHVEALDPTLVILFYTQANDPWTNARHGQATAAYTLEDDTLVAHPPQRTWRLPLYKRSTLYRFLSKRGLGGRDFTYVRQRLDWMLRKDNAYHWRVTKQLLREIGAECERRGAPFAIIDLATNRQISQGNMDYPRQRLLREFAAAEGFTYVDLLDEYPSDPETLFIPDDSHWNSAGHAFVSDVIERVAREAFEDTE